MEFVGLILAIIITFVGAGLFLWVFISSMEYLYKGSIDKSAEWGIYKKIRNVYRAISSSVKSINLKPKTLLDKEIAEEEKEIKYLKSQKAKIDRLSDLKREKDRLYWEIKADEYEVSSGETVYMPIKKWSVDNFKSDEINIESIKADEWHRCKQCGSTKVTGFHFYDRRLGQHIPVNRCSDCGAPINEMERVK